MKYIVGTRGSKLAMTQTTMVLETLRNAYPMDEFEIKVIKTTGDQQANVPLHQIGGTGAFVKRIEEALLQHEIDFAVHSMKDMPSCLPDGLCLCDAWKGENPSDVLVCNPQHFEKKQRIFASGSVRRVALCKEFYPDVEVVGIRGNVDRRIEIMMEKQYDGLILAAAGLHRLNKENVISKYFDPTIFIPACTQGILAIELRCEDVALKHKIDAFRDDNTQQRMLSERAFLETIGGGCRLPMGAYLQIHKEELCLYGMLGNEDGSKLIKDCIYGKKEDAYHMGVSLAKRLLEKGVK